MSNMERLTKDNYVDDCFRLQNERNQLPEYNDNHYSQSRYDIDLWNKVKLIEDIEEELGVDLITLFKALKYGFWAKSSTKIIFCKEDEEHTVFIRHLGYDIEICCEECKNEINAIPAMYLERSIKDYGKTWALDKNELISEQLCDKM